MPTRTTNWPAGTPNWVDCSFKDLKKAEKFYARLFGWELHHGPAEAGGYAIANKHGHPAAALSPVMGPEMPSQWTVYFASDDVDATAKLVVEAGGKVIVEPTDVLDAGRMAFFFDPEGACFGVWQGRNHTGMQIFNEPGSVGWNDLMTRNLEGAKTFYSKVFGFDIEHMGPDYVVLKRSGDDRPVAGMHSAGELPDDAPASWLTHFVVANREASIGLVEELDGEVLASFDTPFGPEAVVRGLEGEVFNIIAFTPEAEDDAEHDPDAQGE